MAESNDNSKLEKVLSDLSCVLSNLLVNNTNLTDEIKKMNENVNTNMSYLADTVLKLSDNVSKSKEVLKDDVVTERNVQESFEKDGSGVARSGSLCCQMSRNYVTLWKELGGANLHFSPEGSVHPIMFIRKVESIFNEAGVPENKRILLAVNCLRGSAQDWGVLKESQVLDFEEFRRLFIERYWGIEEERKLFQRIRFGQYERGSRADYFLKILKDASYLSQKLDENEVVAMVINHFSPEIRRGILNRNSHTVDDVESYLRKIDNTYYEGGNYRDQGRDREGGPGVRNNRQNFGQNNQRPNRQQNVENRESNVPNSSVATMFNKNGDDLLVEDEGVVRQINLVPTVEVKIESLVTRALVDSGSQVTCVSKQFFDKLLEIKKNIPLLPFNCVTLTGAFGSKECKVREQAYLTLEFTGFVIDYPCLIVPGLIRDLILGCDFMTDYKIEIHFPENKLRGLIEDQCQTIEFAGEINPGIKLSVSEITETEVEAVPNKISSYYSEKKSRMQL